MATKRKSTSKPKAKPQPKTQEKAMSDLGVGITYLLGNGGPVFNTTDYLTIAREGYESNVVVSQCVNKIADAVSASANWVLYAKATDGTLSEINNHPILDLLNHPNPSQSGTEFIKQLVSFYELAGNSYIIGLDGRKGPDALFLAPPQAVKINRDANDLRKFTYIVKAPDEKSAMSYDMDHLLQIKTFNPLSDMLGMAPAFPARYSIDALNDAHCWNLALLQNDMRSPGILTLDTDIPLTADQQEQLKSAMMGFTGKHAAGKIPVLTSKFKFQQTSSSPKDSDWLQSIALHTREVCMAFGVPPELMGDSDTKTYANYETAKTAFYEETVLPLLDKICDELNSWLVPKYGANLVLAYDRNSITALQENNDKLFKRLTDANFLTVNEKREAAGYEAIEGGDKLDAAPAPVPTQTNPNAPQGQVQGQDVPVEAPNSDKEPQQGTKALSYEEKALAHTHAAINKRRDNWVGKVHRQVKSLFNDERQDVAYAYRANGEQAALDAVKANHEKWQKLLVATYSAVGQDFARQTMGAIKRQKAADVETKGIFTDTIMSHLANRAGTQVQGIEATTLDQLRNVISTGVAAGEGIDLIAKRIDTLYLDDIIPNRSEVIARTETLGAGNIASDAAAKASGVKLTKTWRGHDDGRERASHIAMNGKTVPMDEPFDVGGEQMDFPMDDSHGASAENIIQCRCCAIYRRAME